MKTVELLKRDVCSAIDRHRRRIIETGERIMNAPELGFKEYQTAKMVSDLMSEFAVPHQTGLAVTGVKGVLQGRASGPTVALLGEMDALPVANHPSADPNTGAAHACGHNAQIAGLVGAMIGIAEAHLMSRLTGSVVFIAVPAEEYVEVGYRMALVGEGKIGLLGGKSELIRLGCFDDIDMAMMIHTHSNQNTATAIVYASSNGFISKRVRFEGKAAHAGVAPESGINALNAAHIALSAINAQRETFRDDDAIRVHPIITKGGESVSVVPAEITMETYIRGKAIEAILDAERKVDRSLKAGAMAVGGKVVIETLPGYIPLVNDPGLAPIFKNNCIALLGDGSYQEGGHRTGSTDMGDISQLMPTLHPFVGGGQGNPHGADFSIADPELAYIVPAKLLAMSVIDLLSDDATAARAVLKAFKPNLSKKSYLDFQKRLFRTETYDGAVDRSVAISGG
jgi:amidohydrolase